mmetsp:Transcript_3408/g.5522  ORF Transcript_3408/g.5522 Transcript_3408/m.5522 type:complete len:203 (-) Transcript_3408:92-700(-)
MFLAKARARRAAKLAQDPRVAVIFLTKPKLSTRVRRSVLASQTRRQCKLISASRRHSAFSQILLRQARVRQLYIEDILILRLLILVLELCYWMVIKSGIVLQRQALSEMVPTLLLLLVVLRLSNSKRRRRLLSCNRPRAHRTAPCTRAVNTTISASGCHSVVVQHKPTSDKSTVDLSDAALATYVSLRHQNYILVAIAWLRL